jgi:CDP-glycerol glycerophosphotransferase (TagB/SpsB family)
MGEDHKKDRAEIAYYLDSSVQEIPSITCIACAAGGIIYTDSIESYNFIRKDYPHLEVRFQESKKRVKEAMQEAGIRVIVYPDYHIRFFKELRGVKHVQVFHGTSDKTYDFHREILEYDLFFIAGEEAYKRYKRKNLLKKGNGILIGYPKLDRVFRGELSRDEELVKLGMEPARKTVLYAPTWKDRAFNSSWNKFRMAVVEEIPDEINLIIKLHPNLKKFNPDEVDEYSSAVRKRKNTLLLDFTPDIIPIMAASDLLISDVSAVTSEYLAFKRPFVFLSNKPKWMWNRKKTRLWECGEVVTRPKQIWPAVRRSLNEPQRFMNQIEKNLHATFYKPDGNASFRAAEAILSLIHYREVRDD